MKKMALFSTLIALSSLVQAQEQGRVLSATPIIQQIGIPQQVCGNETVYGGSRTSGTGAVIGALAGGAVGNSIGRGSGRAAATAIGVLGGAVAGNQIESNGQPQYQTVQRCNTETFYENRTVGYNVVYEYAGRQYAIKTPNDPGAWIPVNVQPIVGNQGQTYSTQPNPYGPQGAYAQPGVVTSPFAPQPLYVTPPVTVIEYGYDGGRPHYPHQRNPYWR